MPVLDCRGIREQEILRLEKEISDSLVLAIIQIGSFQENELYLRNKKKLAERLHVSFQAFSFSETASKQEIIQKIELLNQDPTVTGIMIQKPIPSSFSYQELVDFIVVSKDVDCVGSNSKKMWTQNENFLPCTARSVLKILDYYAISVVGREVAILGKSDLAGMPLYQFLKEKTTVTLCDSKTENVQEVVRRADIVIVAIGHAHYFTRDYFRDGQVIIDVGTNYLNGVLVGDVCFEEVCDLDVLITPVPGGVGALTPVYLFDHLYRASK